MAVSNLEIQNWLKQNKGASDADIYAAMQQYGVTPEQLSGAIGGNLADITQRYNTQQSLAGGIASPPVPTVAPTVSAAPPATAQQAAFSPEQFMKTPGATLSSPQEFAELTKYLAGNAPNSFGNPEMGGISGAEGSILFDLASKLGMSAEDMVNNSGGVFGKQGLANYVQQFFPHLQSGILQQLGEMGVSPTNAAVPASQPSAQSAPITPAVTAAPQQAAATQAPAATQQITQPYGLAGAESAIYVGANDALGILQYVANKIGDTYGAGIQQFSPYTTAGANASDKLSAYTGLQGPEAQAAAFEAYQSSPWVDQVRKNAEKGILQNAAATGGLSGGNVLDQLYRNAADIFLGDFYQQGAALDSMANRGVSGASGAAGMYSNLGQTQAGLGTTAAQIPINAGNQAGAYRYQAGRDISANLGGASNTLASLTGQQGAGVADIVGNTTNNVNTLVQNAYNGDAQSIQQLMTLLSNLSVQSGSQVGSLPIIPGAQTNYLGQLGSLASGVGGLLGGLNA